MPTRLRKHRKMRGSRTCGFGRIGQHRKSGMSGGKGRAGIHKHKWVQGQPRYVGKHGFRCPTSVGELNTINVGELDEMAKRLSAGEGGVLEIDLESMGFDKLLGSGKITTPVRVKVGSCSKLAEEKVREAGGEVLLLAG